MPQLLDELLPLLPLPSTQPKSKRASAQQQSQAKGPAKTAAEVAAEAAAGRAAGTQPSGRWSLAEGLLSQGDLATSHLTACSLCCYGALVGAMSCPSHELRYDDLHMTRMQIQVLPL